MSTLLATALISSVLLPPLSLLIFLVAGMALRRRAPRISMSLLLLSTTALYALSTPWVSGVLLKSLEVGPPATPAMLKETDAIVVLGGGRKLDQPEYGSDTLNGPTLERLRYAAYLHRTSQLPLLVSGGKPQGGTLSEGHIMAQALQDEYGITPNWIEERSLNTWENARLSAPLLKQAGITRIALVSHAWHLRRAVPLFEAQGLSVVPAGTQFASSRLDSLLNLLPTTAALRDSTFALREWLGILWYKFRSLSA